jgi:hypothetical protein
MALPLFAPGVNATRIWPDATCVAVTPVGAAGEPTITATDGAEARPAPRALVAVTVHVYTLAVVQGVARFAFDTRHRVGARAR